MAATSPFPAAGPGGQLCRKCKYWQLKQPASGSGSAIGICRRYPPPGAHDRNTDQLRDGFPQCLGSDWCGEYSAA